MSYSERSLRQQALAQKYNSLDLHGKTLQGETLREVINDLIEYNLLCFANHIHAYDKNNLFDMTGRMTRGIEEFVNILVEIDLEDYFFVAGFRLGDLDSLPQLTEVLSRNFKDPKVVGRLINVYTQLSSFISASRALGVDLGINTIGDGMVYFQSRRIYFHTIQPLILRYCEGNEKIESTENIAVLLPGIEYHLMSIGSLSDYIPASFCLDDYSVKFSGKFPSYSLESNYEHKTLESFFLVPLRIPAIEMFEYLAYDRNKLARPKKSANKIFSFEEFVVMPDNWNEIFSTYNLNKFTPFNKYAALFKDLRQNALHDYFIVIKKIDFMNKIKQVFGEGGLIQVYNSLLMPEENFIEMVNSTSPFVMYDETLFSNVNYLSKFLMFLAEDYLNTVKKYQIDSGFVFERIVTDILKKYKFDIRKIKRVKNLKGTYSEFDVVALKDGKGYNFQCKNNYVDTSNIKTELRMFKQQNDLLLKQYEKAYQKELGRENQLLKLLNVSLIQHIVVSRFPVITRSPYIVTYQQLEDWVSTK